MSETLELVENDLMLIIINMFKDLKEPSTQDKNFKELNRTSIDKNTS